MRLKPHIAIRWSAAAVLLLMFALALTSMTDDSPTFDEQGFLVRGLAYLRGEENGGSRRIRVGHPLGLNVLNAMLLTADPSIKLPSDDPSWQETSFHRPAELFLWEIGNDVERIMFLARLPTLWLGLLLVAVGGRWAAEMAAGWRGRLGGGRQPALAGLMTLILLAFDPNILAHTRLATTDLGLTTGAALAGYTLWRFVRRPSWFSATIAGIGLGLLLNTKFTSLLFLPLFGLLMLIAFARLWRARPADGRGELWRLVVMGLAVYPAVAILTLWAGHGFQVGPPAAPLPLVGRLGGASVPLSEYLDQLLDIGGRLEVSTPSFLLGQYSDSGWWYYFPVAFLLKTPLPVLLLLAWALVRAARLLAADGEARRAMGFDLAALLIPAAGFFAIALTTSVNLGYRHILPILPFLYVLIGAILGGAFVLEAGWSRRPASGIAAGLLGWLVVASLCIYPHYLAFFNALAGGPDGGWRALVDSNLDWGQDLGRLAEWQRQDPGRLWLSYFGEARPEHYGIDYEGLDSFPPRLMDPTARPFYPFDPAPGRYAISATTLQGVHFADHNQFAYFRDRQPAAKIGYSIFLYDQPAHGAPADLLLAGLQVDEIAPEDFALLGTNDVALRWFDPSQAVILPAGDRPQWLAGNAQLDPLLAPFLELDEVSTTGGDGYRLYESTGRPPESGEDEVALALDDGRVTFIDAPVLQNEAGVLTAVTAWRHDGTPQPVKMFVHVLDEDGAIAAQWDGLGVAWQGWRPGDTLVHTQRVPLDGLPPGAYRVVAGLYDPESLRRWLSTTGADVIELGQITIP